MTSHHNLFHNIYKVWLPGVLLFVGTHRIAAQSIDDILADISRNNLQLQVADQTRKAEQAELKTVNNLDRTAFSYSPFFANGVQGVASSEMVVSQDFDFPTLYAQRHRLAREQASVLDKDYEALQRDILLQARLLCLQLIYRHKLAEVLESRRNTMLSLTAYYEKKLTEGGATILDVNKVKMECMQQATAIAQCAAEAATAKTALQELNGGKETALASYDYPDTPLPDDATIVAEYLSQDRALQASRLRTEVMDRKVRISHQNALPSLSVGYRRNTSLEEKSHGFLIGAAVPLFSNRNRTRVAKAQLRAAELDVTHQRTHTEAEVNKLLLEMHNTRIAMQAYDMDLIETSLTALKKATTEGQLSAIDYCRETRDIADQLTAYLELEYRYHTLVATLLKYN